MDPQSKAAEEAASVPGMPAKDSAQALAQGLYARTVEMGIKNKILSLLEQLYGISIQQQSTKDLASKLAPVLCNDLSCEFVSLQRYLDGEDKRLETLAVAGSERYAEAARSLGVDLSAAVVPLASTQALVECVTEHRFVERDSLSSVWGDLIRASEQELAEKAHARYVMLYPLAGGGQVIGVLALVLNRSRAQLSSLERVLFDNAANVVGIAFEKTHLYEALQDANTQLGDVSHFKSQLLSLASHQIKAPLAAMKGYISLILEGGYGEVPENLMKPITAMQRSADGLVELVTSLLDLRKIEEGKMDYSFDQVDLAAMVRDVVEELGMLAREKHLDLTLAGAQSPVFVRADKTKLRQVAQNLVDNAIKYTPSGSVNVSLIVQDRFVTCTVADTGLGMAPLLLPRLFDEFTRDQRVQHTIRGTGLGLYIAKRIMEAHGGGIYADSAGEGLGSRFWFTLPIDQDLPVPVPPAA